MAQNILRWRSAVNYSAFQFGGRSLARKLNETHFCNAASKPARPSMALHGLALNCSIKRLKPLIPLCTSRQSLIYNDIELRHFRTLRKFLTRDRNMLLAQMPPLLLVVINCLTFTARSSIVITVSKIC